MIRAAAAIVPVHDEEETLTACLGSLMSAGRSLPPEIDFTIVAVLDSCTDRSADIAARLLADHGATVRVSYRNVGRARHRGVIEALERLAVHEPRAVWIATTDADSTVPDTWLCDQLALADGGADAVAGTIRIADWHDYPMERALAFQDYYSSRGCADEHDHVHGANLGIRADAYASAGGFGNLETGEDHALWNALRRAGKKTASPRRLSVTTSARLEGRAPRGFADFLAGLALVDQ